MASGSVDIDKVLLVDAGKNVGTGRSDEGSSTVLDRPSFLACNTERKGPPMSEDEPLLKRTIIRFKRRIEDSPSKILVVSYKRSKLDGEGEAVNGDEAGASAVHLSGDKSTNDRSVPVYLRLVGTVPGQEADNNSIAATVRNVLATSSPSIANSLRKNIKARSRKTGEKARQEFKQSAEASRFKIVSSKRGVEDVGSGEVNDNSGKEDNDLLKLLDLVSESSLEKRKDRAPPEAFKPGSITCNGLPMELSTSKQDDDEIGYVYDLYFSNDPGIEKHICGQYVSVEEGDEDLDFGEYRDPEHSDNDDCMDDDDDSNAEDNWRNDYPEDNEKPFRCDDNYGYGGVEKLNQLEINDDSSDDDAIYGIDDDGGNHSFTFDEKYQKFKLKFKNEYADEVVSSASESDVDYGEEM